MKKIKVDDYHANFQDAILSIEEAVGRRLSEAERVELAIRLMMAMLRDG